ncbi:flagellar biosynthesis protein FlgB [Sphingomonas sp. ABOLD]|uniref:Flagellar basal body rod protein FlgB n=1 Tax=Sphingomonas trueperi TaxID=53317 RepID=A0A7X5XYD6_9SPHN|nr:MULTISPECIES: flagellar basal body protein [Sphingomonas]NJB97657.1 flagellar basal-body rod protein FlgB [Sphingomonas trueperi]RSV43529.1 flagellar biosynthesis protein FlgB [Sphingomonas sp. ABOLE]RSV52862.1 flagellar biosynthesis protein FlgB [Sphingomonas sp. ABOLD]
MSEMPTIFSAIQMRMQNLSQRQQVIAQNLANSETPGYKSRDVSEPNFGDLLQGAGGISVAKPRVELTGTMKNLGAVQPMGSGLVFDKDVTETKPDGNNVTLEDQLLKMGKVQADFSAMTNIYRKQMVLLKTALGKAGG